MTKGYFFLTGLEFMHRQPRALKENYDSLNLRNYLLKPNFRVLLPLPWLAVTTVTTESQISVYFP